MLCAIIALPGCGGSGSSSGEETRQKVTVPEASVPKGQPPKKLVIREVKKGTGPAVKAGDRVTVQWAGVLYKSRREFYGTWKDHHPFTFKTSAGRVIPGWDRGMIGMRAGGRRELIIPPTLAYEDTGTTSVPPNETLVYVVELLRVG